MKALIAALLVGAFTLPALAQNADRNGPTAGEAVRHDAAATRAATERGAQKMRHKAHRAKVKTKAAAHRARVRAEQ